MTIPIDLLDAGGVVGISAFALWIIYLIVSKFLIKKKNGFNSNGTTNKKILEAITLQNENHLEHIQRGLAFFSERVVTGNKELVATIRDGNEKIIGLLSEIKGKLDR